MIKQKHNKGQSTIEFCFVIFAFLFFLSMSYNAVVSFAIYQYLSYANFMAARAYQPSRATPDLQLAKAVETMQVYVPNVIKGSQNTSFSFSSKRSLAVITAWTVPANTSSNAPFVLEFKVPFLTLPLSEQLKQTFGSFNLKTSVTLGREPTQAECRSFFEKFFLDMGGHAPHSAAGMEDNGC